MYHCNSLLKVNKSIASGSVAIHLEGTSQVLVIAVAEEPGRSVANSEFEPSVEGPQEAFVENFSTNLGLLRKRLRTYRLKIQTIELGTLSPSKVGVVFMMASPHLK